MSDREAKPRTLGTAVVTGSTSGIGRAIAGHLLTSGYDVVLNYSTDDARARSTLKDLRALASNVTLVKADVSIPEAANRLVQEAVDAFGGLDVLVNNAARVIDKPLIEMTESDWDQVVDIGLKGAFLCSQAAARLMLAQNRSGVIINIGAATGIRGRRNGVNTCASKAGIMVMTKCLALELAPLIRVNTIVPGLTLTDETNRRFGLGDPAKRHAREQTIPMRRLGTPDDVAGVVTFLLSDQARFITGQQIFVDGGQYM